MLPILPGWRAVRVKPASNLAYGVSLFKYPLEGHLTRKDFMATRIGCTQESGA